MRSKDLRRIPPYVHPFFKYLTFRPSTVILSVAKQPPRPRRVAGSGRPATRTSSYQTLRPSNDPAPQRARNARFLSLAAWAGAFSARVLVTTRCRRHRRDPVGTADRKCRPPARRFDGVKLESRERPSRGDAGSPRTDGTPGGETKGKVGRNSRRSSWGWGGRGVGR